MLETTAVVKAVLEVFWNDIESRSRFGLANQKESPLLSFETHPLDHRSIQETTLGIQDLLLSANHQGSMEESTALLKELGQELFDLLVPPETQEQIRLSRVPYLQLTLDQNCVHLPWELIHDGQDFLACRFAVGRRVHTTQTSTLMEREPPVPPFSFLTISNPTGDLPMASEEGRQLYETYSSDPRVEFEWFNGQMEVEELRELLPQFDILHFCGHGEFSEKNPEESSWLLKDGRFQANFLDPGARRGGGVPLLVFNNACAGSRTQTWDGSSGVWGCGMANSFLRAGSHHYLGPITDVPDCSGSRFATRFYQQVIQNQPVGKALQEARLEERSSEESRDLTWAQYLLYGDPAAPFLGDATTPKRNALDESLNQETAFLSLATLELMGVDPFLENFGYGPGMTVIRKIFLEVEDLLANAREARLANQVGHRQLLVFLRPSEAVRFALRLMRRFRDSEAHGAHGLQMRMSLNVGEVRIVPTGDEGGGRDFEGSPVDVGLRMLGVAGGNQILLSRMVFDQARSVLHSDDLRELTSVSWLDHGAYWIKGWEEPIGICEVGEKGFAPLVPPVDTNLAYRYVSPDQEPILGWRPAKDQGIPTSPEWVLTERLGSGGFGEVWRAKRKDSWETRAFKFCFRADRLRSLKREITLFTILRERTGGHKNIVQLFDVYFDEAPYYIEMEDVAGKDLISWCEEHSGCSRLPLSTRLHIVIQVADALQAAHNCGVIHRDVKPSNILIVGSPENVEDLQVKLTDFGIGQLVSKTELGGVPISGFTETFSESEMGTHTGSRLYLSPEVLVGGHSTIRSDIYSLGIVLYQLIVGDLKKPLMPDWSEEVADPLLIEDLEGCLAGNPDQRFAGAAEVARSLRNLDNRRTERAEIERMETQRNRRRFALRVFGLVSSFFLFVSIALGYGLLREHSAKLFAIESQRIAERELYHSSIHLAEAALKELQFARAIELLVACPENQRHFEWGHLLYRCHQDVMTLSGHTNEVGAVDFGMDGSWLASGSADGTVRIWDRRTGEERYVLGHHRGGVWSIAVSSDGRYVASGSEDRTIILWDPTTGSLVRELIGHEGEVCTMDFSPDNRILATGSSDSTVRLWDVESGSVVRTLVLPKPEMVWSLDFSMDGNYLVAGCENDLLREQDQYARVYEVKTGELLHEIPHPGIVQSVAFSPDGNILATGCQDRITRLWDWRDEREGGRLEGHSRSVWDVAFSPVGTLIATAGLDGTIVLWDYLTGKQLKTLAGHTGNVFTVTFDPSGQTLATAGADKTIRLWQVNPINSPDLAEVPEGGTGRIEFTPDGEFFASGSVWGQTDPNLHLWDPVQLRQFGSIPADANSMFAFDFSPDGKLIATSGADGWVKFWDRESKEEIDHLPLVFPKSEEDTIKMVVFHPDVGRIFLATQGGEVSSWSIPTRSRIASIQCLSGGRLLSALNISPIGKFLALSGAMQETILPESVKILDSYSLSPLDLPRVQHESDIRAIAFSPDGAMLATGSHDRTIKLTWLKEDREPTVLIGHQDFVLSLAFSSDSTRLVSGCEDGSCKIWAIENEGVREILTLEKAHSDIVMDVAFSPDNRLMVTGGREKKLHFFPAFPFNEEDLPGDPEQPLLDRIEHYKRDYWNRRNAKDSDQSQ